MGASALKNVLFITVCCLRARAACLLPDLWKLCKLLGLGLRRLLLTLGEPGPPPAAVGMAHLAFRQPLPLQRKARTPPCAISQSDSGAPGNAGAVVHC